MVMKIWIALMAGYGIYLLFKKAPEVLEDPTETPKDTMLVTYSPRESHGEQHKTRINRRSQETHGEKSKDS